MIQQSDYPPGVQKHQPNPMFAVNLVPGDIILPGKYPPGVQQCQAIPVFVVNPDSGGGGGSGVTFHAAVLTLLAGQRMSVVAAAISIIYSYLVLDTAGNVLNEGIEAEILGSTIYLSSNVTIPNVTVRLMGV